MQAGCGGAPARADAVPEGCEDVAAAFKALLLEVSGARVGTYGTTKLRAVTHFQIDDAGVAALIAGTRAARELLSA